MNEMQQDAGGNAATGVDRRRRMVMLAASFALASCGGGCGGGGDGGSGSASGGSDGSTAGAGSGGSAAPAPAAPVPAPPASSTPPSPPPPAPAPAPGAATKSGKRGVAYDIAGAQDMQALSAGASWWYNWASTPNAGAPATALSQYAMGYVPMLWNASYDTAAVEAYLKAHPDIKYILVLNEPNLVDQSNMTPAHAATIWPGYEAVAAATGVKIVGPAMTWGTMAGYGDPVLWLDAFYTAYRDANGGRDPQIDALAFHWYDYGLGAQLDRLKKYGKPFWVTEFANWHVGDGSAAIDTLAKQEAQMADMVGTCESRSDVQRYAWFTGRWSNDIHFTSLLNTAPGSLTELGQQYLALPFAA